MKKRKGPTHKEMLQALIDDQIDQIQQLDAADLNDLVLRGFPAYGRFSKKKVKQEYAHLMGED